MSHRGVKLRSKPQRFGGNGRLLKPPYYLDHWCGHCGMPLVQGEDHSIEACLIFKRGGSAEQALQTVRDLSWGPAASQALKRIREGG